MMHAQALTGLIEKLAPKKWAMEWDNVGLLVGTLQKQVDKALLTLDVTEETVDEAISLGCQLIVAHHPIIFRPLKCIRTDLQQGALLEKIVKHDLTVYAAHTNLDVAPTGVNNVLADFLGLTGRRALKVVGHEKLYKLAVFVPKENAQAMRDALGAAGAGHLGQYSHCSFSTDGEGTFLPLAGSNSHLGEHGKLETVEEERIEVILPEALLSSVVRAMIRSHPYEEVAYDVYALENKGQERALGIIGSLPATLTLRELIAEVERVLGVKGLRFVGNEATAISKVAVCGGSGGDLVYAANGRADVLITGDIGYHQALDAQSFGLCVIDAGHFATEFPILTHLRDQLLVETQEQVELIISQRNRDVWSYQV